MKLPEFNLPAWLVNGICAAFWIGTATIFCLLVAQRFPQSGIFAVSSDLTGNSAFVYPFLPSERTIYPTGPEVDFTGQRVIDDPVYSNVRVPGPYDTVEVSMDFRVLRQPVLEFGLIRDAAGKELELRPWYAAALETADWRRVISKTGRVGYVNKQTPDAVLDQRDTRGLAAWLATSTAPAMSDAVLDEGDKIRVSLRGSHDIWVVPAQGQIDVRLEVQDVNRNRSGGALAITVSRDEQVVKQDAFGTSGSMDQGYGKTFPVRVQMSDLAAGVYKIRLIADDDVFIRSLTVRNPHWVVGPRLVVGDVVGYATSSQAFKAWTASRHLVAETFHKEGLQELQLGQAKGKLQRTRAATRIDRNDADTGLVQFVAPNGDVRIIADGFFAVDQNAYFQPQPVRFSDQTAPLAEGLQAVLTSYSKTQDLGNGWRRASAVFVLPKNADTVRFVLSAPGIMSRAGAVDIRNMTYTFKRPPMTFDTWWRYLLQEAKNAWRRI